MRNLLKQTWIWFVIVGSIAWAVAIATGNALPSFVSVQNIQIGSYTASFYKLDIHNYLKQIENIAVNFPYKESFWEFPSMPSTDGNILKIVPNFFIFLMKFIMWWGNIIIFLPLKLLLQPTLLFITVLGIDINSNNIVKVIYMIYSIDMTSLLQYI